jgi:hypothetical protein
VRDANKTIIEPIYRATDSGKVTLLDAAVTDDVFEHPLNPGQLLDAVCSSVVEFGDQLFGRHVAIGVLDDGRDLVPIHLVVTWRVEEDPQPARESSPRRRGRPEESFGLDAHQFLLHARWDGAPERYPAIAAVIVVVITDGPLVPNKEARFAVTQPFAHLGQREGNPAHPS